MMNPKEENQSGCREQTENEESVSDILENLESYVCDELCCYRGEKTDTGGDGLVLCTLRTAELRRQD